MTPYQKQVWRRITHARAMRLEAEGNKKEADILYRRIIKWAREEVVR